MLEGDDSQKPERRDDGHDRWLAMQSAYAEYRSASEALECTRQSADDTSTSERLRMIVLEGQQRVAFERYLEARMEFLEFRFDESNPPGAGPAAPPVRDADYSTAGSWLAFANRKPVLPILAVLLLCTNAFSLIRQQRHVRDLEAARDELRAALNQTRAGLQTLGQRIDAWGTPQPAAIHQVEHISPAPARHEPAASLRATGRKPSGEAPSRHGANLHAPQRQVSAKRQVLPETRSQSIGARTYYNFSLLPSRQSRHVGPIELSLRTVDPQRKAVSLSIVSGPLKLNVERLRLNEPLWIHRGYGQQPLELVIDRIAGNRLDGHLMEPSEDKPELRASRLRPKLPPGP